MSRWNVLQIILQHAVPFTGMFNTKHPPPPPDGARYKVTQI